MTQPPDDLRDIYILVRGPRHPIHPASLPSHPRGRELEEAICIAISSEEALPHVVRTQARASCLPSAPTTPTRFGQAAPEGRVWEVWSGVVQSLAFRHRFVFRIEFHCERSECLVGGVGV